LKPWGGDAPDFAGLKGLPNSGPLLSSDRERHEIKLDFLEPKASEWALALRVADYLYRNGVGIFAHHRVFRWEPGNPGHLAGVSENDPVRLADLKGYDLQRRAFLDNVEAFAEGKQANNVLIYGERGTGKSSTVKAALNEYSEKGLRLVELSTRDALDAPVVIRLLRGRRERFMLFLDDLSFDADDERYRGLKALLEGSVEAPPDNVILVATSNRRHLMPESFADRTNPSGDVEVRSWDTVEEKLSLSDRFGLVVSFYQPDQDTYLAIVRHLSGKAGLTVPRETLEAGALRWVLENNGRSGRTATQYIRYLKGGH
jgi:predicted AAA+ superfamily ATPase